jgi:putative CocE/NonD family hydrolase
MLILDTLDNPQLNTWQAFSRSYLADTQNKLLQPGFNHLPLRDIDTAVFQRPIPYFQKWLNHQDPNDPYWQNSDYRPTVPHVTAPVHLVAGWYDLFLTGQLDDYNALVEADRKPYLTIGPWTHLAFANNIHALNEAIPWFDAHLKGKTDTLRPEPVKLYLMGADEWRTYPSWPPPGRRIPYYLQDNGRLATHPPTDSHPSSYTYNPADPTPNLGGPLLSTEAGPVDNRPLEKRADVLTFTTDPITEPLDIIGPVWAVLFARTNAPSADFFARLCVVLPNGRSINLCDGIVRAAPTRTDSLLRMEIEMSATAYQFQPGQAIRLQISSGAHPRYARNLGSAQPDADATTMISTHQTIYHDPQRPSALILPITTQTTS